MKSGIRKTRSRFAIMILILICHILVLVFADLILDFGDLTFIVRYAGLVRAALDLESD
jgi:hypothetical protein